MCSLSNFFSRSRVLARSSCLPVSFVFSILVLLLFILQNYVFCVYHIRCGIRYLFSIGCCCYTPLSVHAANKSSQKWFESCFPSGTAAFLNYIGFVCFRCPSRGDYSCSMENVVATSSSRVNLGSRGFHFR